MSSIIIFSRRVDFPIPVFPMIYICLRLSSGHTPKPILVHLKFVLPNGVSAVSGVMVSLKSGSKIGRLDGGSNAREDTQLI